MESLRKTTVDTEQVRVSALIICRPSSRWKVAFMLVLTSTPTYDAREVCSGFSPEYVCSGFRDNARRAFFEIFPHVSLRDLRPDYFISQILELLAPCLVRT